jgi:hypothetical protein
LNCLWVRLGWLHTVVCDTLVCMQVDRLSITLEPRLGAAVRKAAKRAGVSVSAWIADATAARIRNLALRDALDAWDEEDGPLTADELQAAARSLGKPAPKSRRR